MLHRRGEWKGLHINVEGGIGDLGDVSPKGSEPKETWGDKGREGTQKNGNLGRRLLWMVPYCKPILEMGSLCVCTFLLKNK